MHRLGRLEQMLLNDYQHDFPCVPEPYKAIADQLYVSESSVLDSFRKLITNGSISRIGPVFAPGAIGASTLAALAVPAHTLSEIADWISSLPETNHNYEREHTYNLWFVVTTPNVFRLNALVSEISEKTQLPMLNLPLLEQFHIDLGFELLQHGMDSGMRRGRVAGANKALPSILDKAQYELIERIQSGLPLVSRPFAHIWPNNPSKEREALEQISAWKDSGTIKRFGVVVRHHELGFDSNAMVVWDVPDEKVSELGALVAQFPDVTLCYRRPRQLPEWPYNLFCMIHGKNRDEVLYRIQTLSEEMKLSDYPSKVLFSKQRYKQRGARYVFN